MFLQNNTTTTHKMSHKHFPLSSGSEYLRCLLHSKISAAQKMVGNMWCFQRNCFIFKVKILKQVRFSESLLILLEIRFVWINGGQKHSLKVLMSGAQYPDTFFFAVQNLWISCVHYPDKINFISITKIKA